MGIRWKCKLKKSYKESLVKKQQGTNRHKVGVNVLDEWDGGKRDPPISAHAILR